MFLAPYAPLFLKFCPTAVFSTLLFFGSEVARGDVIAGAMHTTNYLTACQLLLATFIGTRFARAAVST